MIGLRITRLHLLDDGLPERLMRSRVTSIFVMLSPALTG